LVDKQERLVKDHDINEEIAKQLVKLGKVELFEKLVKLSDRKTAANVITKHSKQFKIDDSKLLQLFRVIGKRPVPKETLEKMLKDLSEGKAVNIIVKIAGKSVSEDNIRAGIKKIIKSKPELSFGAYMGLAMKQFKGKADGKLIAKILKEELKD